MHLRGLTNVTAVMFGAPSGAVYNVITTCFSSLVSSGSLNPVCYVVSMSVLLLQRFSKFVKHIFSSISTGLLVFVNMISSLNERMRILSHTNFI